MAARRVKRTPPEVCSLDCVCRNMLVGMKTGSVEKKAMRPEMKSKVNAYDVFVGIGRI